LASQCRPCRHVDRHRLAGDDGERDPQRSQCSSAHLEQRFRQSYGLMAATAELTQLDTAIERGTRRLLELQRPDGVWVGELESNVTMTAQHLFWHHYLDLRTPELDRRIANDLLARLRDDGTWSIWFEGPADLRRALRRAVAATGAAGRRRPDRDRRPAREDATAPAAQPTAPAGGDGRRALDPRATGGGRLLGRDPAAVGVGDHRARRAWV